VKQLQLLRSDFFTEEEAVLDSEGENWYSCKGRVAVCVDKT